MKQGLINEEMGVKAHTYAPRYSESDFEQLLFIKSNYYISIHLTGGNI